MLLSFTGYQCQNCLEGLIAKSLVDVSCTAKEPTGSVAVYGQGNTSFCKMQMPLLTLKNDRWPLLFESEDPGEM